MEDEHVSLSCLILYEEIIKNSKFTVIAAPVQTPEEALMFLDEARDKDATHNCWAYKLGPTVYRFNDDGEPSGTAGKPILSAIEGAKLNYVCVLVIRYFGGIKLGANGLVRAYGGCVRNALSENIDKIVKVYRRFKVSIHVEFSTLGVLYDIIQPVQKDEAVFDENGAIITIHVTTKEWKSLESEIINKTRNQCTIKVEST